MNRLDQVPGSREFEGMSHEVHPRPGDPSEKLYTKHVIFSCAEMTRHRCDVTIKHF